MKNAIYILSVVVIFLSACRDKQETKPTEYITITGHYYNANCQPIANAALVLSGYYKASLFSKTLYAGAGDTTDSEGSFQFKVPKGIYTVALSLGRPGVIGGVLVTKIPAIDGTNFNCIINEKVNLIVKVKDPNHKLKIGDTLYYNINNGQRNLMNSSIITNPISEFYIDTVSLSISYLTSDDYIGPNQISFNARDEYFRWAIGLKKFNNCNESIGGTPDSDCPPIIKTYIEECAGQKEITIVVP